MHNENTPEINIDHAAIGNARNLPVNKPSPVVTISPIVVPSPGRSFPLQVKVTVPTQGDALPIILLSHGHGGSNFLSSLHGYGPLADFWAAHGFVVIQPTHLTSNTLGFDFKGPDGPLLWKTRVEDMTTILNNMDTIEAALPQLEGRLDVSRIAVAGHSLGGHTASMLLGSQLTDLDTGEAISLIEPRIKAGLLLTPTGEGGDHLTPFVTGNIPIFKSSRFKEMTTPTLVVIGSDDASPHLTSLDADWHADPYRKSKGAKSLLTLTGAEHILGGISGYDANETTDESPERAALVQRLTWAYLRSALYTEDRAWQDACEAFANMPEFGTIDNKEG